MKLLDLISYIIFYQLKNYQQNRHDGQVVLFAMFQIQVETDARVLGLNPRSDYNIDCLKLATKPNIYNLL